MEHWNGKPNLVSTTIVLVRSHHLIHGCKTCVSNRLPDTARPHGVTTLAGCHKCDADQIKGIPFGL